MNLPKQLKIGGHTYKVEIAEDSFKDAPCGHTDYNDGAIRINKQNTQSEQEQSLIHEAMHVMNKTLNHELLDSLSEQIYAFLKDNKLIK
ncbi:MAG TPA: hypothetical protein VFC63_19355 [Blastocatellia bacterium]|nr:hypothetical protein [Blastocatellia bacterium]